MAVSARSHSRGADREPVQVDHHRVAVAIAQHVPDVRVSVDDTGRNGELEVFVVGSHPGQRGRQVGTVVRVQPGAGLDPLRGVRERRQFGQVQVVRGGERVQPDQGLGGGAGAGVLIPVV
jgi:hypothetical protein